MPLKRKPVTHKGSKNEEESDDGSFNTKDLVLDQPKSNIHKKGNLNVKGKKINERKPRSSNISVVKKDVKAKIKRKRLKCNTLKPATKKFESANIPAVSSLKLKQTRIKRKSGKNTISLIGKEDSNLSSSTHLLPLPYVIEQNEPNRTKINGSKETEECNFNSLFRVDDQVPSSSFTKVSDSRKCSNLFKKNPLNLDSWTQNAKYGFCAKPKTGSILSKTRIAKNVFKDVDESDFSNSLLNSPGSKSRKLRKTSEKDMERKLSLRKVATPRNMEADEKLKRAPRKSKNRRNPLKISCIKNDYSRGKLRIGNNSFESEKTSIALQLPPEPKLKPTLGLILFIGLGRPLHPIVFNNLESLRAEKTIVGNCWANFAASAVFTPCQKPRVSRILIPIVLEELYDFALKHFVGQRLVSKSESNVENNFSSEETGYFNKLLGTKYANDVGESCSSLCVNFYNYFKKAPYIEPGNDETSLVEKQNLHCKCIRKTSNERYVEDIKNNGRETDLVSETNFSNVSNNFKLNRNARILVCKTEGKTPELREDHLADRDKAIVSEEGCTAPSLMESNQLKQLNLSTKTPSSSEKTVVNLKSFSSCNLNVKQKKSTERSRKTRSEMMKIRWRNLKEAVMNFKSKSITGNKNEKNPEKTIYEYNFLENNKIRNGQQGCYDTICPDISNPEKSNLESSSPEKDSLQKINNSNLNEKVSHKTHVDDDLKFPPEEVFNGKGLVRGRQIKFLRRKERSNVMKTRWEIARKSKMKSLKSLVTTEEYEVGAKESSPMTVLKSPRKYDSMNESQEFSKGLDVSKDMGREVGDKCATFYLTNPEKKSFVDDLNEPNNYVKIDTELPVVENGIISSTNSNSSDIHQTSRKNQSGGKKSIKRKRVSEWSKLFWAKKKEEIRLNTEQVSGTKNEPIHDCAEFQELLVFNHNNKNPRDQNKCNDSSEELIEKQFNEKEPLSSKIMTGSFTLGSNTRLENEKKRLAEIPEEKKNISKVKEKIDLSYGKTCKQRSKTCYSNAYQNRGRSIQQNEERFNENCNVEFSKKMFDPENDALNHSKLDTKVDVVSIINEIGDKISNFAENERSINPSIETKTHPKLEQLKKSNELFVRNKCSSNNVLPNDSITKELNISPPRKKIKKNKTKKCLNSRKTSVRGESFSRNSRKRQTVVKNITDVSNGSNKNANCLLENCFSDLSFQSKTSMHTCKSGKILKNDAAENEKMIYQEENKTANSNYYAPVTNSNSVTAPEKGLKIPFPEINLETKNRLKESTSLDSISDKNTSSPLSNFKVALNVGIKKVEEFDCKDVKPDPKMKESLKLSVSKDEKVNVNEKEVPNCFPKILLCPLAEKTVSKQIPMSPLGPLNLSSEDEKIHHQSNSCTNVRSNRDNAVVSSTVSTSTVKVESNEENACISSNPSIERTCELIAKELKVECVDVCSLGSKNKSLRRKRKRRNEIHSGGKFFGKRRRKTLRRKFKSIQCDEEPDEDVARVVSDMVSYVCTREFLNEMEIPYDADYDPGLDSALSKPITEIHQDKKNRCTRELARLNVNVININGNIENDLSIEVSSTGNCTSDSCRLGCVCFSLNGKVSEPNRCSNLKCMFNCICGNDSFILENSSGTPSILTPLMKKLQYDSTKKLAAKEFRETVFVKSDDQKTASIFVNNSHKRCRKLPKRLRDPFLEVITLPSAKHLPSTFPSPPQNIQLPFVSLERLKNVPETKYCLIHSLRNCSCLQTDMSVDRSAENNPELVTLPRKKKSSIGEKLSHEKPATLKNSSKTNSPDKSSGVSSNDSAMLTFHAARIIGGDTYVIRNKRKGYLRSLIRKERLLSFNDYFLSCLWSVPNYGDFKFQQLNVSKVSKLSLNKTLGNIISKCLNTDVPVKENNLCFQDDQHQIQGTSTLSDLNVSDLDSTLGSTIVESDSPVICSVSSINQEEFEKLAESVECGYSSPINENVKQKVHTTRDFAPTFDNELCSVEKKCPIFSNCTPYSDKQSFSNEDILETSNQNDSRNECLAFYTLHLPSKRLKAYKFGTPNSAMKYGDCAIPLQNEGDSKDLTEREDHCSSIVRQNEVANRPSVLKNIPDLAHSSTNHLRELEMPYYWLVLKIDQNFDVVGVKNRNVNDERRISILLFDKVIFYKMCRRARTWRKTVRYFLRKDCVEQNRLAAFAVKSLPDTVFFGPFFSSVNEDISLYRKSGSKLFILSMRNILTLNEPHSLEKLKRIHDQIFEACDSKSGKNVILYHFWKPFLRDTSSSETTSKEIIVESCGSVEFEHNYAKTTSGKRQNKTKQTIKSDIVDYNMKSITSEQIEFPTPTSEKTQVAAITSSSLDKSEKNVRTSDKSSGDILDHANVLLERSERNNEKDRQKYHPDITASSLDNLAEGLLTAHNLFKVSENFVEDTLTAKSSNDESNAPKSFTTKYLMCSSPGVGYVEVIQSKTLIINLSYMELSFATVREASEWLNKFVQKHISYFPSNYRPDWVLKNKSELPKNTPTFDPQELSKYVFLTEDGLKIKAASENKGDETFNNKLDDAATSRIQSNKNKNVSDNFEAATNQQDMNIPKNDNSSCPELFLDEISGVLNPVASNGSGKNSLQLKDNPETHVDIQLPVSIEEELVDVTSYESQGSSIGELLTDAEEQESEESVRITQDFFNDSSDSSNLTENTGQMSSFNLQNPVPENFDVLKQQTRKKNFIVQRKLDLHEKNQDNSTDEKKCFKERRRVDQLEARKSEKSLYKKLLLITTNRKLNYFSILPAKVKILELASCEISKEKLKNDILDMEEMALVKKNAALKAKLSNLITECRQKNILSDIQLKCLMQRWKKEDASRTKRK